MIVRHYLPLLCILYFYYIPVPVAAAAELKGTSHRHLQPELVPKVKEVKLKTPKVAAESEEQPPPTLAPKKSPLEKKVIKEKEIENASTTPPTVSPTLFLASPPPTTNLLPTMITSPRSPDTIVNDASGTTTSALPPPSRTAWTFRLQVLPPTASDMLRQALEEYLGASLLSVVSQDDNDAIVFQVESERVADDQAAIRDRVELESFLRRAVGRDNLIVTDVVVMDEGIENDTTTVTTTAETSQQQPKEAMFVMLIVSTIVVSLALASVLYIIPYLKYRREVRQTWTFSEEREARVFVEGGICA